MDAYNHHIVGWSVDSSADTCLVINARDVALKARDPAPGGTVHADHAYAIHMRGLRVFGDNIRSAGLMTSLGTAGEELDSAMMKSFWSSNADRAPRSETLVH
ncbi:hypothetical protein [Microbacterium faecale]|uniref:hypothetical protein n=1 Tax=Microbacterium faecale TaxID=1804630 RepID=UPI00166882FE|nr:hypothetical protein [Microbacterium faecale]